MGRNLDDFFESVMTHRFVPEMVIPKRPLKVVKSSARADGVYSRRADMSLNRPGSDGFTVNSKGVADFNPSDATKAELLEHHDQGFHEYSSGKNSLDIQFSRRYCPKCQDGNNA